MARQLWKEDSQSTDTLKSKTFTKSFVARRIVCNYVQYVGVIDKVDVRNTQLLFAAASARWKYTTYLEERKKGNEVQQKRKKRKPAWRKLTK